MGQLVDADANRDEFMEKVYDILSDEPDNIKANLIIDAFDEMPTAYDPDKVVKRLEERTAFLKDCVKYGNKTEEQQSKSYDTMMMYEIKDLVDDLIEIVKGGGVNGN